MSGLENFSCNSQCFEFISQLGATFIGAGLGFLSAIGFERWRKNGDYKELKKNLLSSVIKELEQNKEEATKGGDLEWKKEKSSFVGEYSQQSLASFQNIVNSGNLSILAPDLQIELSLLNDKMDQYNFFVREILTFDKSRFSDPKEMEQEANRLVDNMDHVNNRIQKQIEKIYPAIKDEIAKI